MKIDIQDGVFDLQLEQILKMDAAGGTVVHCVAGLLWITQEGRSKDDFVRAGQSFAIEAAGVTVVEAMGELPARVRLRSPLRRSDARAILRVRPAC